VRMDQGLRSSTTLNERAYRKLLGKALPVVIQTEEEYRRLLAAAAELMEQPEESISEQEGRLLEMLGMLIEEYEDRVHPLPKIEPHHAVNRKHLYAMLLTTLEIIVVFVRARRDDAKARMAREACDRAADREERWYGGRRES
jgi:hypothetical protein